MGIGPEWIIVIGILVLVFGASQLPKLARSLGQAKSEFEKGQHDASQESAGKTESSDAKSSEAKSSEADK